MIARFYKSHSAPQSGFTLVEIIVSTAIFITVVSALLVLLNATLQINRRVQTLRELVQGTRAFTETIAREVRNGRIDYTGWDGIDSNNCGAQNYQQSNNQSLAIESKTGERVCFYLTGDGILNIRKQTINGVVTPAEPVFQSSRFKVVDDTFRFIVHPIQDPNPDTEPPGGYPGIQPFVTIVAQFELEGIEDSPGSVINYQTTISTDVYDISRRN